MISLTFIVLEKMHPPFDILLAEKIVKAPIADAFKVLGIDYSEAVKALEKEGISIGGSMTMEEIWISNSVSPEKVIDVIIK